MERFYNLQLEKIFFLYALIRERDEKYNTNNNNNNNNNSIILPESVLKTLAVI